MLRSPSSSSVRHPRSATSIAVSASSPSVASSVVSASNCARANLLPRSASSARSSSRTCRHSSIRPVIARATAWAFRRYVLRRSAGSCRSTHWMTRGAGVDPKSCPVARQPTARMRGRLRKLFRSPLKRLGQCIEPSAHVRECSARHSERRDLQAAVGIVVGKRS